MKNEVEKGFIHVYYGDGKGKTSSAIGLAIRSAGAGLKVYFGRFLKDSNSSELSVLKEISNITLSDIPPKLPFYFTMSQKEKEDYKKYAHQLLKSLIERFSYFDVVILDEFLDAVTLGIFTEEEIEDFLKFKPSNVELVLTGHELISVLKEKADYLSYIKCERHPYFDGISARKGIEY